ncbi:hypothetical protein GIB67_034289 [Kingdonia uniflora]|uniref:Peptidase S59 domain-containing protein n=1 Tax=Kingdonia uniflora TaxID=39325 RepID=A0A7J7NRQ6_9MAGN|nr:hypothetical protein GIB67_034289 [Kingdonia uniflora]
MASTSLITPTGILDEFHSFRSDIFYATSRGSGSDGCMPCFEVSSQFKKRRISTDLGSYSSQVLSDIKDYLPILHSPDYFMEPSLDDLIARELADPGHCCRVQDFTVGRIGYGRVRFLGETDVRWLNLNQIVKFNRHEIVVYEDENDKPVVGQGLNKTAEVTLILQVSSLAIEEEELDSVVKKLRNNTKRQGACFVSFEPLNAEWKFLAHHFSRFGLNEDDEDDTIMDDSTMAQTSGEMNNNEVVKINENTKMDPGETVLSHSLPAYLGLDPDRMHEMRMMMFPVGDESEVFDEPISHSKQSHNEYVRPARQIYDRTLTLTNSPLTVRKTPQALLEYNMNAAAPSPPRNILMTSQSNGMPLRSANIEGFNLDLKCETPISGNHFNNIVDAGLFMGRSFRVGWGPNGVLVHTGGLSSIINIEKVALGKVVMDENDKVKEELIDLCFVSPLNLHKSINREKVEVEVGDFKIKLQKPVSDRFLLSEICRDYIRIIEKQLDVPGLAMSTRTSLMHQVMVWELIKVLFSERGIQGYSKPVNVEEEEEEMMHEKDDLPEIDVEALPLVRRAEFSYWLQESVCHRVQEEISYLNGTNDLEQIFLHLTGRQLDAAVELAASRGDVRLGCLLSQAGGSIVSRSDVARQLDLWRMNGLDFNFIEKDRMRLYELLSGDIQGSLDDSKIHWKRYLGLLMWYHLPPDSSLHVIVNAYTQLIEKGSAPYPVPVYIDEGPVEGASNWSVGNRFDIAYYLMLLYAKEDKEFGVLKTMFTAFSSTHDALDYHMIWHQRAILEANGVFSSNDLHVLDMSFVSQLLSLGQCHWAIYVVLHMPYRDDFPCLQASVIKEILFQYCELWNTQEVQRKFIEELGVPLAWMHEAMGVYFNYNGDLATALDHYLESYNWQKAHTIFMTSVAPSLFLSAKHSEIWRLVTSMEDYKQEIANWDLGAGIFISYYHLKGSLQEDSIMSDLDSLERKSAACEEFFSCLNESLAVWGSRLPIDARVAYSKMGEEICNLLHVNEEDQSTFEAQLSSFETIVSAPLPEDLRACHLQEAISLFTFHLSELAS